MTDLEPQSVVEYSDEIDLRGLIRVLWAGKWLIGGITLSSTIISVAVALMLPNIYRAEGLFAPNGQDGSSGLSALAAQYGGLASLAGLNLKDSASSKTPEAIEILGSRKFIFKFIESHDLLIPLIAAKGWNADTGELVIDPQDFDVVSKKWVRNVRPPRKTIPSPQEAYEEFMDVLSVSQDKKTGFVTVAIEHYSPTIAKQWVDWLINDLNTLIMRQDVAEAEQAIRYLEKQIVNTSLSGLQNVFYSLIEDQTKTILLANVTDEYVFKTLDPAVIPEKKARPKRALIVIVSLLIGGVFGVVVVSVLNRFEY